MAKLLLMVVPSVLCVLMLEVLVRIFLPYCDPRNQLVLHRTEEGVVLGFPSTTARLGTPKGDFFTTVSINRHGYRDVKDYTQATANDLCVTGDSFSFGAGVEEPERYSNVLEQKLGTRVYNLATPAEDIRGYLRNVRFLEHHGLPTRHIILGLTMENDLWDYDSIPDTHLVRRQQYVQSPKHRMAVWFSSHSALWKACSYTIQKYDSLRAIFEKIGISHSVDELTHKNELSTQVLTSSRDQLLQITTNCHSLILIIPSRALWFGENKVAEQQVHQRFVQLLRESGLQIVDMKPVLDQMDNPLDCYFKNDPHWNAKGHAAAAAALQQHLLTAEDWSFLRR